MLNSDSTIAEAKAHVQQEDDVECPVCTSRVKTYKRKLPAADLPALVSLYETSAEAKLAGEKGLIWVHIKELQGKSGGGDFAKFRFWGFIVAKPNDDDPSKKDSGLWRLTQKGYHFLLGKTTVPKKMLFRMGECRGPYGTDKVDFKGANEECWFHFQELMKS